MILICIWNFLKMPFKIFKIHEHTICVRLALLICVSYEILHIDLSPYHFTLLLILCNKKILIFNKDSLLTSVFWTNNWKR